MKLLICGDSFAADWTAKYTGKGWPNLLSETYQVTNLAQAGCSEYKIYLQLINADLSKYDFIIVSHTSPNRIYVKEHPIHFNDPLHKNSDLIYTDLEEHSKKNKSILSVIDFYENYFDLDYAKFIHSLICKEIETMLDKTNIPVIHIANIDWDDLYQFKDMVNFNQLFKTNRGLINHYNEEGNKIIYNAMIDRIGRA